jgi:hypothetical protein
VFAFKKIFKNVENPYSIVGPIAIARVQTAEYFLAATPSWDKLI